MTNCKPKCKDVNLQLKHWALSNKRLIVLFTVISSISTNKKINTNDRGCLAISMAWAEPLNNLSAGCSTVLKHLIDPNSLCAFGERSDWLDGQPGSVPPSGVGLGSSPLRLTLYSFGYCDRREKKLSRLKHRSVTSSSHGTAVPLCKGGTRGSGVFSIYVKISS
jgi:hypothetical protein